MAMNVSINPKPYKHDNQPERQISVHITNMADTAATRASTAFGKNITHSKSIVPQQCTWMCQSNYLLMLTLKLKRQLLSIKYV